MIEVEETRVSWTCSECGREHVQNAESDLYCVCGEDEVARTSNQWEEIKLVRLSDVLKLVEVEIDDTDSASMPVDMAKISALNKLKSRIEDILNKSIINGDEQ